MSVGVHAEPGTRLGGYLVGEMIGRGGMGVVYRATHLHLGREVALKILAPELSGQADFRERFLRESRVAASLDHPNIVTVYDAGEHNGTLYIAMRYVEGTDLARLLAQDAPLAAGTALSILAQVGAALDAAHARGLIHRDVKPGNVLMAGEQCYLTDFGLTKLLSTDEPSAVLTKTGSFLGTVAYIAPEQIEAREVDGRADIYALTCIVHECLTGARPFQRDSEVAVLFAHLRDEPPRPSDLRPGLPAAIDAVVARGMAKDPHDRYPTCAELTEAARAALLGGATRVRQVLPRPSATPPVQRARRRAPAWAMALMVVALIAVVAIVVVAVSGSGNHRAARHRHVAVGPAAGRSGRGGGQTAHVVGAPIAVGRSPIGIAGNSKFLWVANFGGATVTRVSTNGKLRTDIPLPPGPFGVFNTGSTFWVSSADAGAVTPISVANGLAGKPIPVGRHPEFITGDENAVYVSNARSNTVSVIDARTDKPIGAPIAVGTFPRGIAFSGTAVWVADFGDDNVDRIVGNQVIKTIPVGRHPVGVAVGANAIWVANNGDDTVSRIDLGPGGRVKTIRVGRGPFAIAFGFGSAWVTNRRDGTVTRLDGVTGKSVGGAIPVGTDPTGIAVIGGEVWVTDRGSGIVRAIQP